MTEPAGEGSGRREPEPAPEPEPGLGFGQRIGHQLTYLGFSAAWAFVRLLPEGAALGLFRAIADLAWWRRGKGVRRLEANLARVRPEDSAGQVRELARRGMRSYLRYWCEAFRLHTWGARTIRERVVLHDEQVLWDALERGRGVVVPLPHQGNWDLAGAWGATVGIPLTTVAERLPPERLYDRFVRYREALGLEVLPLTGGVDPFDVLAARLRVGGLVCLVADRDLSARGVEVSFFGEPARMPAGPAALALRTGAVLLPVTLWYDGPALHIGFHGPLDTEPGQTVQSLTAGIAAAFQEGIAAHPEDWHMLQRLWTADLDPSKAPGATPPPVVPPAADARSR